MRTFKTQITSCKFCNKEFEGRIKVKHNKPTVQEFCSRICWSNSVHVDSEIRECLYCNVEFAVRRTLPKIYCSKSCSVKHQMSKAGEKEKRVNARKATIKTKYGVNDSANIPGRVDKWKKTMIDQYGSTGYNNYEARINTNGLTKLKQILNDGRYTPKFSIDSYSGVHSEYEFHCNKCSTSFKSHLRKIFPRCPQCYPPLSTGRSGLELEVYEYVKSIYVGEILHNDRKIIAPKELDIVIPDKKLAIEFNGLYWHKENKTRHLEKMKACENKGYQLIQIFEDEWLEKQEIVKSRIRSKLGLISNSIYARKCKIQEIDTRTKNKFLATTHIQGKDRSKIKLGAYHNDELVGVMTFSKLRLALGFKTTSDASFELSRFSTKLFTSTPGLFSKMLKYFTQNFDVKELVTYSDNRWNTGNVYENFGFNLVSTGQPNYWYVHDHQRYHRFNFIKHTLSKKLEMFNPNLTEVENMHLNGYERIWDCGSKKYILKLL